MMLATDDRERVHADRLLHARGTRAAWGDVRFTVVGTEGYVEVQHVQQTVLVVDGERAETIVCADEPVDWPDRCLAGTLMTQEHVFTVTRICLDAQRQARPGNEPAA